MQEIQDLETVILGKSGELADCRQTLREKFSVSRDRGYKYDRATKILYEFIPVPSRMWERHN